MLEIAPRLLELLSEQALPIGSGLFVLSALAGARAKSEKNPGILLFSIFILCLGALCISYEIFKISAESAIILSGVSYLLMFTASLWILPRLRASINFTPARAKEITWGLCLIGAAALPIRFWELSAFAKVHHCEQNISALMALGVLENGVPLFVSSFNTEPGAFLQFLPSDNFFADPVALLTMMFGPSMITLKLLALIFGAAAIVLVFWVGNRWLGFAPGFFAAILLGLSPYMIGLSREIIYAYGLIVPYSLLVIHFLLKSIDRPSFLNLFGAAVLAFGAFYIYFPALVLFPLVLGFWSIYFLASRGFRSKSAAPLFWALILALPILVPYFYMLYWDERYNYLGDLARYMRDESRLNNTDIFNMISSAAAAYWPSRFFVGEPMNFLAGVGHIWGKTNGQHLPLEALAFFVGLAFSILNFRKSAAHQVIIILFALATLPGLLSSPTERRYLVEQCAFYLIAGQGLALVCKFAADLFKGRFTRIFVGALCLLVYGAINYGLFIDRARAVPRFPNREAAEMIAARLNTRKDSAAIFTWEDQDSCTVPGLAGYLAWNKTSGRWQMTARRMVPEFKDLRSFESSSWPSEIKTVRIFMRRSMLKEPKAVEKIIRRWGGGPEDNITLGDEIFWIDAARGDFSKTRDFICANLLDCPRDH